MPQTRAVEPQEVHNQGVVPLRTQSNEHFTIGLTWRPLKLLLLSALSPPSNRLVGLATFVFITVETFESILIGMPNVNEFFLCPRYINSSEEAKIRWAVAYLDTGIKNRWIAHAHDDYSETTWETFSEWLLSLRRGSAWTPNAS
jgi:hypothetical protein